VATPADTDVIVKATAIDCMSGVKKEQKTISKPED
jgi:hypothetical protein